MTDAVDDRLEDSPEVRLRAIEGLLHELLIVAHALAPSLIEGSIRRHAEVLAGDADEVTATGLAVLARELAMLRAAVADQG